MSDCRRCGAVATATLTYHGLDYDLCRRCGGILRGKLRDTIIANVAENKRLRAELDSLRLHAPAADDDGLVVRDGVIVGGWAH